MPGPYSGKFGVVNAVDTVRDWSITDGHESKPYSASNTLFGMGNTRGVEFWEGNYNRYAHTPAVLPGELFHFIGYGAPLNNVSGTGWRYGGWAMGESAVVTWNWGAGDILSVQETFKGHTAMLEQGASGAAITDEVIPSIHKIACTKYEYSQDGSTWTEWLNLVQGVLTLTCELQEFVNSSTIVDDNGQCRIWKGYRPGRVNWTLAVTEQDVQRGLFTKGESLQWRLYVNETDYYELKWGQVKDFTGIQVNRETGAIIQQTVNIEMNGFDPAAADYAGATGHVLLPSGEQWWPDLGTGTGT